MKHLLITLTLALTISAQSFAQNIEDEVGFIYTKAKYLLETERLEDAVKELNKVIQKKADFEDALLLRAEAKYVLGAYTGVKKDLELYIAKNGITARVARLYGLSDYQGGNKEAAFNSISMALYEIKDDRKLYELRAEMYEKKGENLKACDDYKMAAKLGSGIAKRKYKTLCGNIVSSETRPSRPDRSPPMSRGPKGQTSEDNSSTSENEKDPNDGPTNRPGESHQGDVVVDGEVDPGNDDEIFDDRDEVVEEEDNSVNEIVVDEDLTLLIRGGGLGSRDIMRQPNILIISDDSGEVAIDVCVSEGGRITSAVYNNESSTIKKQSLVSLAIRKAKEFWFERENGSDDVCGKIIFRIKGA